MHCARILCAALVASVTVVVSATSPVLAQQSAVDALRTASRGNPADAPAAIALARALRRAGLTNEAATELRRALPYAHGPVAIDLHYEAARVAIDRDEHGRALGECRAIQPIAGGDSAGHACLAEAHLSWRRASEALVETAEALANGTQNVDAKVAEGLAYELELKDDLAERSFRDAIAWKPDAWQGHLWLGRLLIRELKRDEGLSELRRAASLDPYGPEASYELARTMPSSPESAALLEKAVHERPTYGAALRRLAEVDLEIGRGSQARAAAEAALKFDPKDAGSHLVMGHVALAEKNGDVAIAEAQAALKIVPNSAPAKLIIADTYASRGEVDLAVENYQAAYGFDHADPASLVRASVACHAAGRETSAKAFGEKASKEFPDWAPGWVALGDALVGNKEIPAAKLAYETALKSRGPLDGDAVRSKLAALR